MMGKNPMFATILFDIAKKMDLGIAFYWHRLFPEKNALIVLLFHAVARDDDEIRNNHIDPRFSITVEQFRRCVEYYIRHGYIAVSPVDIMRGLRNDRRYVMFSFDDGYFNNAHVIPILEGYQVPALFAIATDNVQTGKSFWWDVLYRQRVGEGTAKAEIWGEAASLIPRTPAQVERYLIDAFDAKSLQPIGDIDRPFSPVELCTFAANPYVFLANHSAAHEWLPSCSTSVLQDTFARAQTYLAQVTGQAPISAVYPFGTASPQAVQVARTLGLKLGFTTRLAKQSLPIDVADDRCMSIPRFTVTGGADAELQCKSARFDWRLSTKIGRGLQRFMKRPTAS